MQSQSIVTMIPNIMKWQVAMTAVMLPLRKVQEALESINTTLVETENRIIAIRRVAGDAANANELYKLAQQYGQTFENVADVVERFAKSGYDWEESLKAAESALVAINVAELDASQATEGLIAVIKQYGMELEDLNYIQGVLNKTADNAAVTTEKLLIALQKTGSTADNANISFEKTVGLITALSEGTAASGQNIGNALRSLIVFTKDDKALSTFASLSENMSNLVDQYRTGGGSIVDVWKGLGEELKKMEASGETLRDVFGGVNLDSDIAAKLTEVEDQIAEVYGTAGNYRQNYFIALLENLSTVEKVTNNLSDANTYSQKENLAYLDSYEAKSNQLQAKWQEIANDEQGWLKTKKILSDVGIVLLTLIDYAGGLNTVFIGAGIAAVGAFGPKIVSLIKTMILSLKGATAAATSFQMAMGWISVAVTVVLSAIGAVTKLTNKTEDLNQETKTLVSLNRENANELERLLGLYKSLDHTTDEYKSVEESIVQMLGKKSSVLEGLTRNTDEYREAVKKLAEAEIQEYRNGLIHNYGASQSNLANFNVPGELKGRVLLGEDKDFNYAFNNDGTAEGQLYNYNILKKWKNEKDKLYQELLITDPQEAQKVISSSTYQKVVSALSGAESVVTDYVNSSAAHYLNAYEAENGKVDTLDKAKQAYYYIRDNGNLHGVGDIVWEQLLDLVSIGGGNGGTTSSSSRTDKTEQINLEKSRLSVLQAQDASVGNQINALAGINALLDEQILYLQETGADETEINKLLVEKANNQKEINKLQEEYLNLTHQTKGDYYSSRVDVKRAELDSLRAGGASTSVIVSKLQEINEWNVKNLNWLKANGGSYEDILKAETEILNTQKEIDQTLKDETISILEEIRDTNKESYEYEEKKKAVLEAEKALLDAQSNRMTKIYNAETGSFEFVANEKDVQKAREDLEARRLEIEESAYNEIIALLESGEKSEAKIAEILSKWGGAYGSATPSFVTTIANALGIPTPSILSSLLSPSSNATVTSFSQSLGLLFGGSKSLSTPSSPIISGSSSHVSHDSSYTVNGVPIPVSMAEQYTIKELFEAMQLV